MAPIIEHWWFSCTCGFGGWAVSKPAAVIAMSAHADYVRRRGEVNGPMVEYANVPHVEQVSERRRVGGKG